MKSGRELDALIAEKVMGCSVLKREIPTGTPIWITVPGQERTQVQDTLVLFACGCSPMHFHNNDHGQIPEYSTDIAAAWKVVDKITQIKCDGIGWFDLRFTNGKYQATFQTGAYYEAVDHIEGDIAPLTICLAALKVVGAI